jgi:hypothetical protein
VVALLSPVPRSAYDLAVQVWSKPGRRNWDSLHPHLRRNAVGLLAAHLELLADNGAGVRRHEEAGVLRYTRP